MAKQRQPQAPRAAAAPVGYGEVVQQLRQHILDGRWQPGAQLPPWSALQSTFRTTPVTLQRAVQVLIADGYLRTQPRAGTFVTAQPPHLHAYGLVFWNAPAGRLPESHWSRYYTALTHAAIRLQHDRARRFVFYHSIDQHTDTPDRQRLERDLAGHRLAGLIFANSPHALAGTPILDLPGIPRVALASASPHPQVTALRFDQRQWLRRAVAELVGQGRRRLAFMANELNPAMCQLVARVLAEHGLPMAPHWLQAVNVYDHLAPEHCARLLLYAPASQRPDGLIVLDDNLVPGMLAGVRAAGVAVPAELGLVVHSNFPCASELPVPARCLGYDIPAVVQYSVELIDRLRAGLAIPARPTIPPAFTEELAAGAAAVPRARRPPRKPAAA